MLVEDVIRRYDRVPGTGLPYPQGVETYLSQQTDWVNDWARINEDADAKVGTMKDDIEREFRSILGIAEITPGAIRSQPSVVDILGILRNDLLNALRKKPVGHRPRVK